MAEHDRFLVLEGHAHRVEIVGTGEERVTMLEPGTELEEVEAEDQWHHSCMLSFRGTLHSLRILDGPNLNQEVMVVSETVRGAFHDEEQVVKPWPPAWLRRSNQP